MHVCLHTGGENRSENLFFTRIQLCSANYCAETEKTLDAVSIKMQSEKKALSETAITFLWMTIALHTRKLMKQKMI
jgi:hypothetical protein